MGQQIINQVNGRSTKGIMTSTCFTSPRFLSFNGIDNLAVAVQRQRVIHTETIKFASQP